MRDVKAYLDAGRSDPSDAQQMREHPYDFVSLPDQPARADAVPHDQLPPATWSGSVRLVYRTEGPLHVGSGHFERAEDCGFQGRTIVRGIMRGIVRSVSGPILPGSSWKGAVRARFEAITRSRLALAKPHGKEKADQMPESLRDGDRYHQFTLTDPKVAALENVHVKRTRLHMLSPADSLFGCMGYRGRVLPCDGIIRGGRPSEPLPVAPMDSPQVHRLAKPGALVPAPSSGWSDQRRQPKTWQIKEVEGRKFYYDGDLVQRRDLHTHLGTAPGAYDLIDWIAPGAEIDLELRIHSASLAELGALLIAAGHGDDVGILRFGGYKSVGLGKVALQSVEAEFWRGGPLGQRRPEDLDVEAAVAEARRTNLIDEARLHELHRITTAWRKE